MPHDRRCVDLVFKTGHGDLGEETAEVKLEVMIAGNGPLSGRLAIAQKTNLTTKNPKHWKPSPPPILHLSVSLKRRLTILYKTYFSHCAHRIDGSTVYPYFESWVLRSSKKWRSLEQLR